MRVSFRSRCYLLAAWLLVVLSSVAASAQAMTKEQHVQTFMRSGDIPGMRITESDNQVFATPYPKSFPSYGGEFMGNQVWKGKLDDPLFRVVEMRWSFGSAADAQEFLDAEVGQLAEKLPPLPRAPSVGDESHMFGGSMTMMEMEVRTFNVIFRVGPVVAKLWFDQGPTSATPLDLDQPLAISKTAEKRIIDVVGGGRPPPKPTPKPPPEPSGKQELRLGAMGWTLRLGNPPRFDTKRDGDADVILWGTGGMRVFYAPRKKREGCKAVFEDIAKGTSKDGEPFTWAKPTLPDGFFPKTLEETKNGVSLACIETAKGAVLTQVAPSLTSPVTLRARTVLTEIARVAKVDPVAVAKPPPSPTPTPSPSPSPKPRPTPSDDDDDDDDDWDDDDWDIDWDGARFTTLRFGLAGSYIIPGEEPLVGARMRQKGFGLAASTDIALYAGEEIIGFLLDGGALLGYDFDGNVPLDVRLGVGFALNLGPLSIGPAIGVGIDTRGAGDELTTHQMDGAFYWYPSGRLRLGLNGFGIEGWAARTFRGSIDATGASDVRYQTRVVGRFCIMVEEETELYFGARWTRYEGATNDVGVQLYPDADQFGGLLGVGFSSEDLFD